MKKIGLLVVAMSMVITSCGNVEFVLPKPELSKAPTSTESELIKSVTPEGFTLQDARRIDTQPPFVFAAYGDGQYKLELKVYEITDGKISKTYDSGVFEGELMGFNDEIQNNSWGKLVTKNVFVLPVSIYMGGNDGTRAYNKIFTITDGKLIEIPVNCEPGTVARAMLEDESKLVLPISDGRFQFFNDLYHVISPYRIYIFEYDSEKKAFIDATPKHRKYCEDTISETIKAADENKTDSAIQASGMVSVYLQAEAGGFVKDVLPKITALRDRFPNDERIKKTWDQIQDAIDNNKPFASFAPWGDEMDYRWKPFDMKELK